MGDRRRVLIGTTISIEDFEKIKDVWGLLKLKKGVKGAVVDELLEMVDERLDKCEGPGKRRFWEEKKELIKSIL